MKRNSLIILVFTFLITLFSCESLVMDRIYTISLKNNSNHSINAYALQGETKFLYPDTLVEEKKVNRKVFSSSYITFDSWIPWEDVFKKLPKDTLSIFIFHTDTLNKYSWEEVRNGYKILKRYDLSLQDIERLNYNVPYPPSPEMAKMKMYPKYP